MFLFVVGNANGKALGASSGKCCYLKKNVQQTIISKKVKHNFVARNMLNEVLASVRNRCCQNEKWEDLGKFSMGNIYFCSDVNINCSRMDI